MRVEGRARRGRCGSVQRGERKGMEIVVYSMLEMATFEVVVGWGYRERIHCGGEARE